MNIGEMMKNAFWETDIPDFAPQAWEQGYQQGFKDCWKVLTGKEF